MKKLVIFTLGAIVLASVAIFSFLQNSKSSLSKNHQAKSDQSKLSHFLDSTPLDSEIYAKQPINVTLNFDTDLVAVSSISVSSSNNSEVTIGDVKIEDNNTVLKKDLKSNLSDGPYTVKYKACFASGPCSDGKISFWIDSEKISQYQDLRSKKNVSISMKDLKFNPEKIIISPDTIVVWTNDDTVDHFVNTETHPEHTYFPQQNSKELKNGNNYSLTFDMPGQYNYHCSAHVPEGMLGSIIVAD